MTDDATKKYEAFTEKFLKQDVYFRNTFEGVAYRWSFKEKKYYARVRGGREFEVKIETSNVLADAVLDADEITREEYMKG